MKSRSAGHCTAVCTTPAGTLLEKWREKLAVLESPPFATGCLFVLFSFSKTGVPRDINIILGLRTWRTDCGTLALVFTQFGKQ